MSNNPSSSDVFPEIPPNTGTQAWMPPGTPRVPQADDQFQPLPVRLGPYSFASEAEQRTVAEAYRIQLYGQRANILSEIKSSFGEFRVDPKSKKVQVYVGGGWVEASPSDVPERLSDLLESLGEIDDELAYLDDWEKGIGSRAKVGKGSGAGGIADEVTPEDVVDRYVELAKDMLDIYRKEQSYNIDQAKEQRERIKFAKEQGIEPWFNNVPVPLFTNFAAPVQTNVEGLAGPTEAIGRMAPGGFTQLAQALDQARKSLYPGFASGTRRRSPLSAILKDSKRRSAGG